MMMVVNIIGAVIVAIGIIMIAFVSSYELAVCIFIVVCGNYLFSLSGD
jgi:hypothetical protein